MAVGPGAVAAGPVLQTERLELRLPQASDLQAMYAIVTEPETGRYLGSTASLADHATRFMRNAGSWLLYGYGSFMVRRHGEEALLGNVGIFHSFRGLGPDFDDQPEAGWILRQEAVGQGLAREAMDAVLDWFAHMHGPRRIVCMIETGNAASLSLAARMGFHPMRHATLADGCGVILHERPAAP